MKNLFFLLFSFSAFFAPTLSAQLNIDSLMTVLDQTISESEIYSTRRQKHIDQLRQRLSQVSRGGIEDYHLNHQLYLEFKAFICDSAIYYLNNNIRLADSLGDLEKSTEARLELSYLLASSGMYNEAIDVLKTIDRHTLQPQFLSDYYWCMDRVYGEMGHYTQDKIASHRYWLI